MAEDPTAPIRPARNGLWWSLTALGMLAIGLGAYVLVSSPHDASQAPIPVEPSVSVAKIDRQGEHEHQEGTSGPRQDPRRLQSTNALVLSNEGRQGLTRVRISSEPTGALVWRGRKRLGLTPLKVHLPTDENRVFVRLTLEGHRAGSASFVPNESLSMTVPLSRLDSELVETPEP